MTDVYPRIETGDTAPANLPRRRCGFHRSRIQIASPFLFRLVRAGFTVAACSARSARMRSSSMLAGSSFGSWGMRRPSKARLRMDWRRMAARLRALSRVSSRTSAISSRLSMTEMACVCSVMVGIGIGRALRVDMLMLCWPALVAALSSIQLRIKLISQILPSHEDNRFMLTTLKRIRYDA